MITHTHTRESYLVDESLNHLPALFGKKKSDLRVKTEVGVGRNIADIVFLLTDKKKKATSLQPLNIVESTVISLLRQNGPTRIDLLEDRCGVEHGDFREGALDRLVEWEAVSFSRGGRVSLTDKWMKDCCLIAIEAKLTKWTTALKQAVEYKGYADKSYVLLPESNSKPAMASRDSFIEHGVGLLVLTDDSVECLIPAKKNTIHSWRREFVYSRMLNEPPSMSER